MSRDACHEPARRTPVTGDADVVVCGGGPAGVAAAIRAARHGAKTLLLEAQGCLGGIWTSGLLGWILDHENKPGLMREIRESLRHRRLTHVITESKSGREAVEGRVFIDCTGDGDLGALAGCGFDFGHPEPGRTQPSHGGGARDSRPGNLRHYPGRPPNHKPSLRHHEPVRPLHRRRQRLCPD
jgi:hypothetical protein